MLATTQAYKDAVYASARSFTARVIFDISDVTAVEDVTSITTSAQLSGLSDPLQLNDGFWRTKYKLATLEQDRFALDGTFSFADSNVANNGEVGYVSSAICDAAGVFATPITMSILFGGPHSSAGVTVTFDDVEYATEFRVTAYNASDVVIADSLFEGNTETQVQFVVDLTAYKRIDVTINKWSVGNRRARVLEVDFGLVVTYTDDSLVSIGLIEELDLTSGTLPSPEFQFTIDNSDRAINILNPTGFYRHLQQRQVVLAELGLELDNGSYEYVGLGKFLLWEWTSEEGSMTATFRARTNLDLMPNYTYERLTASNKSLTALAEEIFAICGITYYTIDSALDTIFTNSLAEKVDCRTALQMIAIAGRCNVVVDRDGFIVLKRVSLTAPVDTVDFDNIYQEPKIELEKVTKQVDVSYWTDLDTSTVVSAIDSAVTLGDTLVLDGNTFIDTASVAQAVADWLLAQKQYRAKYFTNWRGNPAQGMSDSISMENSYGDNTDAIITKAELTYTGYLQATMEAKGAVN